MYDKQKLPIISEAWIKKELSSGLTEIPSLISVGELGNCKFL